MSEQVSFDALEPGESAAIHEHLTVTRENTEGPIEEADFLLEGESFSKILTPKDRRILAALTGMGQDDE